jgi:hypothetical protein
MHCLTYLHLIVFFVNARGLLSKMDVLREYAVKRNLHIIGIAETFFSFYGYKC